jgi:MFS transporter, DHA1 family, inner membrane transport protein
LLLALNNTATYGGLACSGVLGGLVLLFMAPQYLSIVGAGMIAIALVLAEAAHLCTEHKRSRNYPTTEAKAGAI